MHLCASSSTPPVSRRYSLHLCVSVTRREALTLGLPPLPFWGEHRPFEWGWRAVGLCSPCLWWWGRLCRRRCAAGGCARAVLVSGRSLGGKHIIIVREVL